MTNLDVVRDAVRRLAGVVVVTAWAAVLLINAVLVIGVGAGAWRAAAIVVLGAVLAGIVVRRRCEARVPRAAATEPRRPGAGLDAPAGEPQRPAPEREAPAAEAPGADGFTEDLHLTVWVGVDAGGDRVLERRTTRPAGDLRHRQLRLISAYAGSDTERAFGAPALAVVGAPVRATWQARDLTGRGIVVFTPPVNVPELRWELSYSVPHGLWNPLREVGMDVFRYDVRAFPIGTFTVEFVIPANARAVFLRERNHRGTVSDVERNEKGAWIVRWRAGEPAVPAKYEWDVRVSWAADPA